MILIIFVLFTIIASTMARCYVSIPLFILSVLSLYIIPGIAIQKLCKTLDYCDYNKLILSSFAVGYSFSLILYFICLILGVQKYIIVPSIVILILGLFYIRKDILSLYKLKAYNTGFLALVLSLAYLTAFVCTQLCNLSPEVAGTQDAYMDLIFWFRNAVAATKSYPLPDLSVMDNYIYYHYFSSIGLAYIHYITHIELFDLCFTYSYLINLLLFVGSIYVLMSEYTSNKKLLYLSIVIILFTTSYENILVTTYITQLYAVSNGFVEGLSLSLFSYYFFKKSCSAQGTFTPWYLSLMVFFCAIGCKAPVAIVVLFGILFNLMIIGVRRKEYKKTMVLAVCYITIFCLVMMTVVLNIHPSFQSSPHGGVSPSYITVFRTGFPTFTAPLIQLVPNVTIQALLYFAMYIMLNSFLVVVCGLIALKHYKTIKWSILDYGPLAIFLLGYFLFLFTNQAGFSQSYFYFVTIPFGFVFLISMYDNNAFKLQKWEKQSLIAMTIIGLFFFVYAVRCWVVGNKLGEKRILTEIKGNSLDENEFDALRWVRDHTEKNAVLLSNKISAKEMGRRSYVVSAFTERQVFLEGYEYGVSVNDPVISARREHIINMFENNTDESAYFKKNGVTHFVIFKNLMDKKIKISGEVIYENAAVIVTKL